MVRTGVEDAQQVPKLMDLGLNWCCGSEQQVARSMTNLQHEFKEIVRLIFFLPQPAPSASFMGFVKNDSPELLFQQKLAFVGFVEDQAGRDDCDTKWAARDVLRATCLDDMPFGINPDFLSRGPHRTWGAERVCQFNLPLQC